MDYDMGKIDDALLARMGALEFDGDYRTLANRCFGGACGVPIAGCGRTNRCHTGGKRRSAEVRSSREIDGSRGLPTVPWTLCINPCREPDIVGVQVPAL